MSLKSPFKKDYSEYEEQESSNLLTTSEHLSDLNILKSRETYGKKRDYKNLSNFSENGNYTKELCGEEISESVTSVVSSCSENTNVHKDSNVNSEFCLFNDEDTDYYFSVSTEVQKDPPSIPEASYSSSYYQCTRKNLKSRLSNQDGSYEEMSESNSQEENSDSPNEFKSVGNFLNLAQMPSTAESCHVSVDNKVEHTRNGIKSTDAFVNKLPQKPIVFQMANQAGKTSGEGTLSSNMFSIVNLVKRFSESNKQALSKSNSAIKQKRIQGRCGSVSTKKIVVKHDVSSKVKFDVKKTFKSTNSVRNKSISDIGKRDVKSSSKAVKKGDDKYIKSTERSIRFLQKFVSNNKPVKKSSTTKGKCPSTSYLQMVRNETTEKIQSDNGDKQIENPLFLQSHECVNQKQVLNDIPEKDVVSNFALHMPCTVPSINNSIQTDNQVLLCKNFNDLSIPGPSTFNNNYSSLNAGEFNVKILHSDKRISDLNKDITTTTNITENNLNSGIDFEQFLGQTFRKIEDKCILECKKEANESFLKNPSLLNLTVKTFFESTRVRNVFLDYIDRLEMDESSDGHNLNKGYDFSENFENESVMTVVKDFLHTANSYFIPADAKKPITLTYSQIVKAAMLKMSAREIVALMHVFRNPDPIYELKDVISRLCIVALLVIFHEYEKNVKKR